MAEPAKKASDLQPGKDQPDRRVTSSTKPPTQAEIDQTLIEATGPGRSPAGPHVSRDSTARNTFEIGSLVQGKYEILEVIGQGAMGVVYKARQVAVGKVMAIKRIQASDGSINVAALRRFQREAQACFKLDHKNIVTVFDFDPNEGDPFLVMEFVEGKTLSEIIESKIRLSIHSTIEIAIQLCEGLADAHKHNILHRDLKPQNIMVQEPQSSELFGQNEPPLVKIMDFGLAKSFDIVDDTGQALTKTGEACGTPLYMSPEQCRGEQLDERSDIYSLGCVIYQCLTGQPPFVKDKVFATLLAHINEEPQSLRQASLAVDFPPDIEKVVARMLKKHPGERHKTMDEVKQDLKNLQTGRSPIPATQAASDRSENARIPTHGRSETKKISMNSIDFCILVLAIAVVSASAVWVSDYISHGAQNTNRPTPQKVDRLPDALSKAQNAMSAKDYKAAGDLYEQAYVLAQEEKAEPKTLTQLTVKLACALVHQGKISESEPLFGQLTNELKISISPLGRNADALVDMDDLVDAYRSQASEALRVNTNRMQAPDQQTRDQEKRDLQALTCLEHCRIILEGVENLSHKPTSELTGVLDEEANLLTKMQKDGEAAKILEELIDAEKRRGHQYSFKTATSLNLLAFVLERNRQYQQAEVASKKAYDLLKTHFPKAQAKVCDSGSQSEMSEAAWRTAEIHAFEKRKSSLAEAGLAFQFDKVSSNFINRTLIQDLVRMANIYVALGEDSQAESYFKQSLAAARKGTPTIEDKIAFSSVVSKYAAFLRKHNRIPEALNLERSLR